MDIRLNSAPIRTPEEVYQHLVNSGAKDPTGKPGFLRDLVFSSYEIGDALSINPEWAIAQGCLESGHPTKGHPPFVSDIFLKRGMHVGMGVTDSHDFGYGFATGKEAAEGQFAHLFVYVYGTKLPKGYEYLKDRDPRWDAVLRAGWEGTVKTVDDLAGKWATDKQYGEKLRSRYRTYIENAPILPDTPQPDDNGGTDMADLNFDPKLVPMPPHRFKLATNKREGVGMNRFGPRVHRGIVFHRALSNNQSLDTAVGWLLRSDVQGLTDGFIDHRTGEMVIINPMKVMFPNNVPSNWQDMAGWAQGPYSSTASWPDGRAFRNAYGGRLGANIINQDLESMEVTGNYETPISEACKATLTQWAASRAQYHKIPWDKFPIIPSTGLTMIYGHREFCGDGHKVCPGKTVWDFINGEMIDRVRAVLKKAQTSGATTPAPKPDPQQPSDPWPYAEAHIPEFITNPGAKPYLEDGNGTTLFWTDKQYVAVRPTKRLKYAYDGAPEVGPLIPKGTDFNIAFVFTAHNGKEYGLTPYGTRVLLDDLEVVSDGPLVGDVIDAVKDTLENN